MATHLVTKHLKIDDNGRYRYRRRVPKGLRRTLGKTEFVKVLGRTEDEALRNYVLYHNEVERITGSTLVASNSSDILKIKESLEAQFADLGLDPFSSGTSEDERTARGEAAERVFRNYPIDAETGFPDEMSPKDKATVTALLSGLDEVVAEPNVSEAFAFYLNEKSQPDEFKRKKQIQRFYTIRDRLLSVLGADVPISKVTRHQVRRLRDNLLLQMIPSSVKRNINDVKAVFSFVIREFELTCRNPFEKLDYPKEKVAEIDKRLPLPDRVILSMYEELSTNTVPLDIWTLMHHTVAQNAETLGLTQNDLFVNADIPYILIRPNRFRGVK